MPIPAFFIFVNSMHVEIATVNIWRRFYKKRRKYEKEETVRFGVFGFRHREYSYALLNSSERRTFWETVL